jgi:hypothetical protein
MWESSIQVQKVFWPVVWTLSYLGGDPVDSTAYMTINTNTGVISRTGSYPPVFTQQVYKIDGIDASLSRNKVSAYVIVSFSMTFLRKKQLFFGFSHFHQIKLPQCNSG